jgi:hypothetical protein
MNEHIRITMTVAGEDGSVLGDKALIDAVCLAHNPDTHELLRQTVNAMYDGITQRRAALERAIEVLSKGDSSTLPRR